MDIRDEFAKAAMAGCLAYSHIDSTRGNWQENATPQLLAVFAYQVADAMLAVRDESPADEARLRNLLNQRAEGKGGV